MSNIFKCPGFLLRILFCLLRYIYGSLKKGHFLDRFPICRHNNDKSIHILGNGPSLNEQLDIIEDGDDVISVNFLPNTKAFYEIKPKYHCLIDAYLFSESKGKEKFESNKKELYLQLESKVDWPLTILIPSFFELKLKNPNIKVVKINTVSLSFMVSNINGIAIKDNPKCFYRILSFFYRMNLIAPKCNNVLIFALYFSINKRYQNIYLHGVDSDFYKNININNCNELVLNDTHAYGVEERNFSKESMDNGMFISIGSVLSESAEIFETHRELSRYAKGLELFIINMSRKSMIDSYDRYSPGKNEVRNI